MKAKFIYESLNEIISFERGKSPLSALGIGQKLQIEKWLEEMVEAGNYKINNNYTINADSIFLNGRNLVEFPEYIQFNEIKFDFRCCYNLLTSLKGCPKKVGTGFVCYNNHLISLKGCPVYVGGMFSCSTNNLTSLKHCPQYVGGPFFCYENKVKFTEEYIRSLCDVKGDINN